MWDLSSESLTGWRTDVKCYQRDWWLGRRPVRRTDRQTVWRRDWRTDRWTDGLFANTSVDFLCILVAVHLHNWTDNIGHVDTLVLRHDWTTPLQEDPHLH